MSTFTFICLQGQLGATFSLLYRAPSCESIRKYWLRLVKYGKVWLYIYIYCTYSIYIYIYGFESISRRLGKRLQHALCIPQNFLPLVTKYGLMWPAHCIQIATRRWWLQLHLESACSEGNRSKQGQTKFCGVLFAKPFPTQNQVYKTFQIIPMIELYAL